MTFLFSNPILFSLCLIPTIFSLWILQIKKQDLKTNQIKVEELHKKAIEIDRKNKINEAIFFQINESDPKYLQKELERLPFLESELKRLETILVHNKENPILNQRLTFLKSRQNQLTLKEVQRRKGALFQEVELTLDHPVEMDDEDLKKTLASIEGIPLSSYPTKQGRPQILIREFDLTKETNNLGEEIFLIQCNLLKREPL